MYYNDGIILVFDKGLIYKQTKKVINYYVYQFIKFIILHYANIFYTILFKDTLLVYIIFIITQTLYIVYIY